jgi:hypothetical protein
MTNIVDDFAGIAAAQRKRKAVAECIEAMKVIPDNPKHGDRVTFVVGERGSFSFVWDAEDESWVWVTP